MGLTRTGGVRSIRTPLELEWMYWPEAVTASIVMKYNEASRLYVTETVLESGSVTRSGVVPFNSPLADVPLPEAPLLKPPLPELPLPEPSPATRVWLRTAVELMGFGERSRFENVTVNVYGSPPPGQEESQA